MTPQQLIGTAIRLFSIWLALSSIAFFSAIPTALSAAAVGSGNSVAASYAVGAVYVLVAILLWLFPMSVAHKLLPRTSHANRLDVPGFELARAGVGLLGLWVVAKALPTLVWVLFRAFLFVDVGSTFSALAPDMKLELAVAIFEILLGAFLVMRTAALARAILRTEESVETSRGEL